MFSYPRGGAGNVGPKLPTAVCPGPRSLQTTQARPTHGQARAHSSHLPACSSDLEHGLSPQEASQDLPEDAEMAVDLQTDKILADIIMDSELDKWTPGQRLQR